MEEKNVVVVTEPKSCFQILNDLNVNGKTEKRSDGKTTLTYLSWVWAWGEIKKLYPDCSYTIKKFNNGLPYVFDEKTGYMVFTEVTIGDTTHEMWLPVMNGSNRAMKDVPYTYKTKYGESTVESATMFDINKTIMRCLTKNLAMFGLGLYIYAGEDLPESEKEEEKKEIIKNDGMTREQKKLIDILDDDKKQVIINHYGSLDLTIEQADKVLNNLRSKGLL